MLRWLLFHLVALRSVVLGPMCWLGRGMGRRSPVVLLGFAAGLVVLGVRSFDGYDRLTLHQVWGRYTWRLSLESAGGNLMAEYTGSVREDAPAARRYFGGSMRPLSFWADYGPHDAREMPRLFDCQSWFRRDYQDVRVTIGDVPIVGIATALAFVGPWSFRARRRKTAAAQVAAGRCPACGYDLRATPGRCPECGRNPSELW